MLVIFPSRFRDSLARLFCRRSLGGVACDPAIFRIVRRCIGPYALPGGITSTSISKFSVHPKSLYLGPVDTRSLKENIAVMSFGNRTLTQLVQNTQLTCVGRTVGRSVASS